MAHLSTFGETRSLDVFDLEIHSFGRFDFESIRRTPSDDRTLLPSRTRRLRSHSSELLVLLQRVGIIIVLVERLDRTESSDDTDRSVDERSVDVLDEHDLSANLERELLLRHETVEVGILRVLIRCPVCCVEYVRLSVEAVQSSLIRLVDVVSHWESARRVSDGRGCQ